MNARILFAAIIAIALPVAAAAQEPAQNVSTARYGNLAAAQALSRGAYDGLAAAEQANEFDLGGHAARAKVLLLQANQKIARRARAANQR